MRAVIQRVTKASVAVGEEVVSSIGRGLCVFIGIHRDDKDDDMQYIIRKLLNMRIFDSESKRWDKSVKDLDLDILCVSQFTLHGYMKGNKIDFHNSMGTQDACNFYNKFLDNLKAGFHTGKIHDGRFAAMMSVEIVNDGPVTLIIDSKNRE